MASRMAVVGRVTVSERRSIIGVNCILGGQKGQMVRITREGRAG